MSEYNRYLILITARVPKDKLVNWLYDNWFNDPQIQFEQTSIYGFELLPEEIVIKKESL